MNISDLANVAGPTSEMAPYTFAAACRVGFSDTDAQGIVYYGRYAPYFDMARVEYFRHLKIGRAHGEMRDGEFVMRHFAIDYHAPAHFDDLLEVFMRAVKIGTSSLTFEYAVYNAREERLLATATQVMVFVDLEVRRPQRIVDSIRGAISQFEGLDAA